MHVVCYASGCGTRVEWEIPGLKEGTPVSYLEEILFAEARERLPGAELLTCRVKNAWGYGQSFVYKNSYGEWTEIVYQEFYPSEFWALYGLLVFVCFVASAILILK